ncbi:hypothetical protein DPM33_32290 [Mesorhizobium hawassense]|uniref:Uncharacterized protein n=1 Tax=Mesorhizobium hawassense TaxID=1209954 RepID=A0A330HAG3_9HYPH|nr:hypothetical protein DPM33_32290 [Mesorhizobium hawassense]
MKILNIRPEPPGCGNVIARVDVEIDEHIRLFNLKVSRRPEGGFAVFAPNANGARAATFSRYLVDKIATAAVAVLKEPMPHGRHHTI